MNALGRTGGRCNIYPIGRELKITGGEANRKLVLKNIDIRGGWRRSGATMAGIVGMWDRLHLVGLINLAEDARNLSGHHFRALLSTLPDTPDRRSASNILIIIK